jgi:hypothetical protein
MARTKQTARTSGTGSLAARHGIRPLPVRQNLLRIPSSHILSTTKIARRTHTNSLASALQQLAAVQETLTASQNIGAESREQQRIRELKAQNTRLAADRDGWIGSRNRAKAEQRRLEGRVAVLERELWRRRPNWRRCGSSGVV